MTPAQVAEYKKFWTNTMVLPLLCNLLQPVQLLLLLLLFTLFQPLHQSLFPWYMLPSMRLLLLLFKLLQPVQLLPLLLLFKLLQPLQLLPSLQLLPWLRSQFPSFQLLMFQSCMLLLKWLFQLLMFQICCKLLPTN